MINLKKIKEYNTLELPLKHKDVGELRFLKMKLIQERNVLNDKIRKVNTRIGAKAHEKDQNEEMPGATMRGKDTTLPPFLPPALYGASKRIKIADDGRQLATASIDIN